MTEKYECVWSPEAALSSRERRKWVVGQSAVRAGVSQVDFSNQFDPLPLSLLSFVGRGDGGCNTFKDSYLRHKTPHRLK